MEGAADWGDEPGGAVGLHAEYFQQALIGPFIPHLCRMGPDRGMIGYTGLAWTAAGGCAGLAAVRIGVTSEEG